MPFCHVTWGVGKASFEILKLTIADQLPFNYFLIDFYFLNWETKL